MAALTTRYEKTCETCGTPFMGLRNSRYCCKKCRDAAILVTLRSRHEWKQKFCVVCGKPFKQNSNGQKVCSEECRVKGRRDYYNARYSEQMKDPETRDRRRASARKRYEANKDKILSTKKLNRTSVKTERKALCCVCGKEFVMTGHNQKLCSTECQRYRMNFNFRTKYAEKRRKLAQELQTTDVVETHYGSLHQDFIESLSIRRLSERGCECLKCGNKFNLICAEKGGVPMLNRLAAVGKSPCPYCGDAPTGTHGKRNSTAEYEIQKLYPNFSISNYHPDWMNGLELDLYDPVSKTALEYHGVTWHCGERDRGLQKKKADLCEANGVHLIQLYDTEWLQKREIVQDKLDAIFHKDMRRIFARKLKVMEITGDSTIRPFLEKNHIQGYAAHKWAVGLWNGLELVAVCTFKYGTAYASGGQCAGTQKYWELNRYATKLGCSVIGGLSRCVKAFFRTHTEVTEVFSFADRRWTSPVRSAYSSSGFVEVERVAPNYQYTDTNPLHELQNKQQFRKSRIALEHPEIYSDGKTEKQMATELGMFQIWDAGKIKYSISR